MKTEVAQVGELVIAMGKANVGPYTGLGVYHGDVQVAQSFRLNEPGEVFVQWIGRAKSEDVVIRVYGVSRGITVG